MTTQMPRLEKRVEGNVGRIHQFAFEVDDRLNKLAQQVTPTRQDAPAPETQSLSSGASVSSTSARSSQVASGKLATPDASTSKRTSAAEPKPKDAEKPATPPTE